MTPETMKQSWRKFEPGAHIRCVDASHSYRLDTRDDPALTEGAVYVVEEMVHGTDVVLRGVRASWDSRRFEKSDEPAETSDFGQLKSILTKAIAPNLKHRRITEYVTRAGTIVQGDYILLTHGGEADDRPYAEFIFSLDGRIVLGGANVWCAIDGESVCG